VDILLVEEPKNKGHEVANQPEPATKMHKMHAAQASAWAISFLKASPRKGA